MFRNIYDSLLTLAYPQTCQICQNSVEQSADGAACRKCWNSTRIFSGAEILCEKCGAFLRESGAAAKTFCHLCDEHFYNSAKAVGLYEKSLAASVVSLKREPSIGKNLNNMFTAAFEHSGFQDSELLIPIPLSKKRQIERGFNQATVLAEILSKKFSMLLDDKSLVREIHTPMHRAGMDKKAREATVKNAFAVARPNLIENKTITLIDDVFTSGATASACAKVLKESGASAVYVLTLARAF